MRVDVLLPSPEVRKLVRDELTKFFRTERDEHFDTAVHTLVGFYGLKPPVVEWVEGFKDSRLAGLCYEDGRVQLLHPSRWKRHRVHKTLREWRSVVLHELGHLCLWADAERKADAFAAGMLK